METICIHNKKTDYDSTINNVDISPVTSGSFKNSLKSDAEMVVTLMLRQVILTVL